MKKEGKPAGHGGVRREIDRLGRVVVPVEWRRKYGLKTGTPVAIHEVDEGFLIEVICRSCALCGTSDGKKELCTVVTAAGERSLCSDCRHAVAQN